MEKGDVPEKWEWVVSQMRKIRKEFKKKFPEKKDDAVYEYRRECVIGAIDVIIRYGRMFSKFLKRYYKVPDYWKEKCEYWTGRVDRCIRSGEFWLAVKRVLSVAENWVFCSACDEMFRKYTYGRCDHCKFGKRFGRCGEDYSFFEHVIETFRYLLKVLSELEKEVGGNGCS